MGTLAEQYNTLLASVKPQEPLRHATLETPGAIERRDIFFHSVRSALERRLSALAVDLYLRVEQLPKNGEWGDGEPCDILTIDSLSPVAFARQVREDGVLSVRFGVMPVNQVGEQILKSLEEADAAFSAATFRT